MLYLIKAYQKTNFSGRMEACGPVGYNPPDFIEICKAYKVKTMELTQNSQSEKIIDEFFVSEKFKRTNFPHHHINDCFIKGSSLYLSMFSLSGNWKALLKSGTSQALDAFVGLNHPKWLTIQTLVLKTSNSLQSST